MIKSFLIIGQSNIAGRGFLHEVPPIYNERIQMLRNGRWQMMTEPVNYDRPVAGISLVASFAEAWCQKNNEDSIGLIPCAEGGSSIDEWAMDGVLFRHAISEAKFALQTSELAGILWHQGESDSMGGKYKSYYEKLQVIMNGFREELDAFDIPLIIGGLGDFLGTTGFGKHCTKSIFINQELQKFASEQDHCYFVTATGLTANPDGIHFDAISQRKFGLRYFKAFSENKDVMEPLLEEEGQLVLNPTRSYTKTEKIYIASLDLTLGKITYQEFESQLAKLHLAKD